MAQHTDLYKVLQVRQDADPEVISSAYRSLCKKNHPDLNNGTEASSKMAVINAAYEVLSDHQKRAEYDLELLSAGRRTGLRKESNRAKSALFSYFSHLKSKNYKTAYRMLPPGDREKIPYDKFSQWQEAVARSYEIKSVELKLLSHTRGRGYEFEVLLTEMDLKRRTTETCSFVKNVEKHDENWCVGIGHDDVDKLISRFFFLSLNTEINEKKHRVSDRNEFIRFAEFEAFQTERYKRPFSVALFGIPSAGHDWSSYCELMRSLSTEMAGNIRRSDACSLLGENLFAVLFTETDQAGAETASEKLISVIVKILRVEGYTETPSYIVSEYQNGNITDFLENSLNSLYK